MFGWLRNRRRRRILAQPFPAEWEAVLRSNVWQYETLSDAEQARLRDDLRIFVAEKNWEGCGGLEMTDEVKVTIAAYACLIVLGLSLDSYDRVLSILVYPDEFYVRDTTVTREGFHRDELVDHLGEAWHGGPVILSWADTLDSGRHRGAGTNVVIHEFAHQLDMLNASVDGMPPLRTTAQIRQWRHVMTAEYNLLVRQSEQGDPTFLDEYAATNIGEFFAVATEYFFEQPVQLRRRHPALYAILRQHYRQDLAARTNRKA